MAGKLSAALTVSMQVSSSKSGSFFFFFPICFESSRISPATEEEERDRETEGVVVVVGSRCEVK